MSRSKRLCRSLTRPQSEPPSTACMASPCRISHESRLAFAVPVTEIYLLATVHRESPLRVLGGSRGRVSRLDFRIRQTCTASPAEPGVSFRTSLDGGL